MTKKTLCRPNKLIADNKRFAVLYKRIADVIHKARTTVKYAVDATMAQSYWLIGKYIVEEEQRGIARAGYGEALLEKLSIKLSKEFGQGFSTTSLWDIRRFYLTYSDTRILHAVRGEFVTPQFNPHLSWTHYRALMRVTRPEVRSFYELEASKNHWSARELERQINSLLFERLAKSRDKKGLLKLVQRGQEVATPADSIKEPLVLEFLGLPEAHQLVETKLEEALINNLQHFLLELGTGFAFVARQKRLTLEGEHFYADLVFYHTILKCYVIIDLKTKKLTHTDLGQMQFYINYFDQEVITKGDNPTIGLILCTQKNDAMVKYTLGVKSKRIFTSKYQFHLPTEKELEAKLKREIKDIKHRLKHNKSSAKHKTKM